MKIKWRSTLLVASFILLLIGGTFIYHSVEGWSYLDSSYFMIMTATTIGYGDIVPQTSVGKIITMFYSMVGIAFMFYIISLISHSIFDKRIQLSVTDVPSKDKLINKIKKRK